MKKIKRISVKIGDKPLGSIEIDKTSKEELDKMKWMAILNAQPIVYSKGVIAQISSPSGFTQRFTVKEPFAFHGWTEHRVLVTIPVTLDTLKGLGFISKVKG